MNVKKLLFATFYALSLMIIGLPKTHAQSGSQYPFLSLWMTAQDISESAIRSMPDVNYLVTQSESGSLPHLLQMRLNRVGDNLDQIEAASNTLMNMAAATGYPGLIEEAAEIKGHYQAARSSFQAIVSRVSAGFGVPASAAQTLQTQMVALREAGPCIRREIQELQ